MRWTTNLSNLTIDIIHPYLPKSFFCFVRELCLHCLLLEHNQTSCSLLLLHNNYMLRIYFTRLIPLHLQTNGNEISSCLFTIRRKKHFSAPEGGGKVKVTNHFNSTPKQTFNEMTTTTTTNDNNMNLMTFYSLNRNKQFLFLVAVSFFVGFFFFWLSSNVFSNTLFVFGHSDTSNCH